MATAVTTAASRMDGQFCIGARTTVIGGLVPGTARVLGHHATIPRLIHLNGPPAVGKSTIAAALVDDLPLALLVDIDGLRVQLGRWREQVESKALARALGFSLALQHLATGHDVVLPQLTVRRDVVEHLSQIAHDAGAEFVEVVLVASPAELRSRLASISSDEAHPRSAFSIDELTDQGRHAAAALEALAALRPATRVVDVSGADIDSAIAAVRLAID